MKPIICIVPIFCKSVKEKDTTETKVVTDIDLSGSLNGQRIIPLPCYQLEEQEVVDGTLELTFIGDISDSLEGKLIAYISFEIPEKKGRKVTGCPVTTGPA